jgi:hypothetical protein
MARNRGEEFVTSVRRSISGQARADHIGNLIDRYDAFKYQLDEQLDDMNHRLEVRREEEALHQRHLELARSVKLLSILDDERLLLDDEIHQLGRGALSLMPESAEELSEPAVVKDNTDDALL